jgi:hypothetical protein
MSLSMRRLERVYRMRDRIMKRRPGGTIFGTTLV